MDVVVVFYIEYTPFVMLDANILFKFTIAQYKMFFFPNSNGVKLNV